MFANCSPLTTNYIYFFKCIRKVTDFRCIFNTVPESHFVLLTCLCLWFEIYFWPMLNTARCYNHHRSAEWFEKSVPPYTAQSPQWYICTVCFDKPVIYNIYNVTIQINVVQMTSTISFRERGVGWMAKLQPSIRPLIKTIIIFSSEMLGRFACIFLARKVGIILYYYICGLFSNWLPYNCLIGWLILDLKTENII